MPKKTKLTPEDLAAFEQAMQGIKRLKDNKIRLSLPKKIVRERKSLSLYDDDFNDMDMSDASDSLLSNNVKSEEFIAFKQASISNKILKKLRKGQYNVQARLDLHGMSVNEAKTTVHAFLVQCLQQKNKVVLIIHGKGHHSKMPILKNKLNQWLRHSSYVLAFCSASIAHGGRGATYVLLKG